MLLAGCPPGFASHEDAGAFAQPAGLGDAASALDLGAASLDYNPAGLGAARTLQVHSGFRRAFIIPGAMADLRRYGVAAALPVDLPGAKGVLGLSWSQADRAAVGQAGVALSTGVGLAPTAPPVQPFLEDRSLERTLTLAWASRGWRELGPGTVDLGVSLKELRRASGPFGGGVSKAGVDVGILYRLPKGRAAGVSVLNVNGPRTDSGGIPDRAPVIFKAGYAHAHRGFLMSADLTKREPSFGLPPAQALGLGAERWWHTIRSGSFSGRTGLSLSDRARAWSLGAGWRVLGAELGYAVVVPLESGSSWGNSVSLVVRFGTWNPEAEYERLLGSEMRYRVELSRALESAEVVQWKLQEELRQLKAEIEALRSGLTAKTAEEAEARRKLSAFEERERAARARLAELERKREEARQKTVEMRYQEDWAAYLGIKSQGAPDASLIERVKQILREYREAPVDLSEPNAELSRLLRNR